MLKVLKCDLARCIANRGFICAVIVIAVLCFSAQIYSDNSNGKSYSVFEALFSFDRAFMSNNSDFSPRVIIKTALSGYSAMVLPVTAAFPFVFSFITERNSGNMLFTISRTNRGKYYFSKFISAISSGGSCTMFGVILFGILVYILFPNADPPDLLERDLPNGVFTLLVKKALSAFIYGRTSVLPAFFLCSFCRNSYIILCVPFMLKFILETLLAKFQTNALASGDIGAYEQAAPFYPDAVSRLFDMPVDKVFYEIIAVNIIFVVIVFAGFVVVMENRADRGR